MYSLKNFSKSLIIFVFVASLINPALAKRRGLAKKYAIPAISDSHIILGSASESHLDPNSIKILVWNIYKGDKKSWKKDFINLSQNQDILLLQEGYLNSKMETVFGDLDAFRFDMGVSFLYKKDNNTPTGTLVGSRVEPSHAGLLRTTDYEPFIKTPKTTTFGKYPIANHDKELLVLSIHGMNLTKQRALENQIKQALKVIDAHDGPVVFAGDFNTRTKKRLRYMRARMRERNFKELSFLDDKRMKFAGNILDHAFTRGLLIRDSKVLKYIKGSDHKAMQLELVLDTPK